MVSLLLVIVMQVFSLLSEGSCNQSAGMCSQCGAARTVHGARLLRVSWKQVRAKGSPQMAQDTTGDRCGKKMGRTGERRKETETERKERD